MDDKQIIDLLWQRVEDAIEWLRYKYGQLCLGVSYSILRSREDAEECVNDTYMKVWDSIPPTRPDNLSAYMSKITRNLSLDKLRSSKRLKRGADNRDVALSELEECLPAKSVEDTVDENALAEAINKFLLELPSESRMIFVGRYWNYRSVAELAEDFGISQSKVKTLLFRVRTKMRENLEKEGFCI